jgi:hypothetical protein
MPATSRSRTTLTDGIGTAAASRAFRNGVMAAMGGNLLFFARSQAHYTGHHDRHHVGSRCTERRSVGPCSAACWQGSSEDPGSFSATGPIAASRVRAPRPRWNRAHSVLRRECSRHVERSPVRIPNNKRFDLHVSPQLLHRLVFFFLHESQHHMLRERECHRGPAVFFHGVASSMGVASGA